MFLDFHTHILPGIDDGSRSVDESKLLFDMLASQGVGTIVATPHYDPNNESVERFLERRRDAFLKMSEVCADEMPNVRLGAEVAYYPGISRLEGLSELCVEGTKFILLEMPESKWSQYTLNEIANLSTLRGLVPVIAHVERCVGYQDKSILEWLCQNGVLIQINASFVINLSTRWYALRLLSRGVVHLIGSDCHNLKLRAPRIDKAYNIISKKLGTTFVDELVRFNNSLISE